MFCYFSHLQWIFHSALGDSIYLPIMGKVPPCSQGRQGRSIQWDFCLSCSDCCAPSQACTRKDTSQDSCSVLHCVQLFVTPMDRSTPGSSVPGIFQAGILEWAAISSPRGSSQSRIKPLSPALQSDSLPLSHQGSPLLLLSRLFLLSAQVRSWRRQWQPTPVLLPRKSHGWRSLVGCSSWGC